MRPSSPASPSVAGPSLTTLRRPHQRISAPLRPAATTTCTRRAESRCCARGCCTTATPRCLRCSPQPRCLSSACGRPPFGTAAGPCCLSLLRWLEAAVCLASASPSATRARTPHTCRLMIMSHGGSRVPGTCKPLRHMRTHAPHVPAHGHATRTAPMPRRHPPHAIGMCAGKFKGLEQDPWFANLLHRGRHVRLLTGLIGTGLVAGRISWQFKPPLQHQLHPSVAVPLGAD